MAEEKKHSHFVTAYLEYVYEGLLAFTILIVANLVDQPRLDLLLKLALGCFAIALPFLTLCLIMVFYRKHSPTEIKEDWVEKWRRIHPAALTVALGTGMSGVVLTFFHISTILGILFAFSTIVCLFIHHICVDRSD
jgi:hypothetical protein